MISAKDVQQLYERAGANQHAIEVGQMRREINRGRLDFQFKQTGTKCEKTEDRRLVDLSPLK